MANEQYSEQLVEIEMKVKKGENSFGFVFPQGDIQGIEKIENLLKKAGGKPDLCDLSDFSKGGNGKAKPEYVITFNNDTNTILVVECKRSIKDHSSEELNKPKKFAIDGALYYAKFLKEEYNVVAIAVSGTKKEDCKISTFYWQKGFETYSELSKINIILEPLNYLKFIRGEKIAIAYSLEDIRRTAIDMSNKLRIAKVTANNKPIFIAGILIALQDETFDAEYQTATNLVSLIERLQSAITRVLKSTNVKQDRIDSILSTFNDVASLHHFQTTPMTTDNSLRWYIQELDMKIKPMMNHSDSSIDALGEFYQEFIKFSNGDDGKALGIVLTPQHLTDFMCEVSGLNKNSKVVDICAGSGGFLVTAMSKMMKNANPEEVKRIRQHGLFGVEADPNIYALCIANMIVRRDGKSNIHYGSCFDTKIVSDLQKESIDIGLINPPYSQEDHNELAFVEQLLSVLATRGVAVAVVPLNCALGTTCKAERERLFQKHTLEAVFSMPTEIFNPAASAPPCVMVWIANVPHPTDKQTFFGYYREDGFVKRKKLGRVDAYGKWEEIKNEWLKLYRERDVKSGLSVKHCVKHTDEWCAEAYMETDYSKLNQTDFEKKIKEYIAFKFLNNVE
jgi:type I restriction-modification system DNA methylase subunit